MPVRTQISGPAIAKMWLTKKPKTRDEYQNWLSSYTGMNVASIAPNIFTKNVKLSHRE